MASVTVLQQDPKTSSANGVENGLNQGKSARPDYKVALATLTLLFFMWGFITCMNDIMIPFFQTTFSLGAFDAGLIQFFFFFAYFTVSLLYFVISSRFGDPISKIGYKNGIIIGLLIAGFGCCLFYPAAEAASYAAFLAAFFILAAGITLLQMAANPYVALLGSPETSSSRLNMTQAFNSLGTTIAPIIGAKLIFAKVAETSGSSLEVVKLPYIGLAVLLLALAVIIKLSKLPSVAGEKIEKGLGVLKFSHLTLGVLAIFMYVGGEVAIGSYMAKYFHEIQGLNEEIASIFIAFYWGGAMIGRFNGALLLTQSNNNLKKYGLLALIMVSTLLVVYLFMSNMVQTYELTFITPAQTALIVFGLIVFNIIAFRIGASAPSKTLGIFGLVNVVLILITTNTTGVISLWSVIGIGIFNSIMFPTIFTLAINKLGKYTSQGSSLLVMGIVGGAIITPIIGKLADLYSYQVAYLFAIVCYVYIAYYGFSGYKVKKSAEA